MIVCTVWLLVRLPLDVYHYITRNLNRILLLLAIYLAVGALAAVCKNNDNNCVTGQCDTVGETEICMQCAKTYVPGYYGGVHRGCVCWRM